MAALRRGTMKLVRPKAGAQVELYDLEADRGETTDLASKKPDVASRMETEMNASRTEPRPQSEPPHPWWDVRS